MTYKTLPSEYHILAISTRKSVKMRKYAMFILVLTISFLLFSILYMHQTVKIDRIPFPRSHYSKPNDNIDYSYRNRNYTIKTEGCIIPGMDPFDASVKNYTQPISEDKMPDWECSHMNEPLFKRNRTHLWIEEENKFIYRIYDDNYTCCCQAFYRPDAVDNVWDANIDNRIEYKNCTYFKEAIEVQHEFVKVACYSHDEKVYENAFLFTPKKKIMLYDDNKEIVDDDAYNVIILGLDTVSRLNFHRIMPKTLKFLKSKGAIELQGYNKVGSNSYPNVMALLMGLSPEEVTRTCYPHMQATYDSCPLLWTWYKKAGYYTALAEDTDEYSNFNYFANGFIRSPTDYYVHPFAHETRHHLYTKVNTGLCIGDQYFYKILLEYVENLLTTLKPSKLFAFFWELTVTHNDVNAGRIMDESYLELYKRLEAEHHLENTIVVLLSDHGLRYGPLRSTTQGRMEESLPFVSILTPPSFQRKFRKAIENLKINSGRLTTPFDVHETLMDLIDLDNIENSQIHKREKEYYSKNRGISLFLPIPENRTCAMAHIAMNWCTCVEIRPVELAQEKEDAANLIVDHINEILEDQPKCVMLFLDEVISVHELFSVMPSEDENNWREYVVVVRTQPGDGLFEGIVRFEGLERQTVKGVVNRINAYGSQSRCVHNAKLKLYCYCSSD